MGRIKNGDASKASPSDGFRKPVRLFYIHDGVPVVLVLYLTVLDTLKGLVEFLAPGTGGLAIAVDDSLVGLRVVHASDGGR